MVLLDHVSQGSALERYTSFLKDEIANITSETTTVFRMQNLTGAVESYAKHAAKLQLRCSEAFKSLSMATNNPAKFTPEKTPGTPPGQLLLAKTSTDMDSCNEKLGLTERYLLLEDGLPGRPWFKHCLQAPGLDLGYAAEAFPGIQQALDQGDYPLAQAQIDLTTERIRLASVNLVP